MRFDNSFPICINCIVGAFRLYDVDNDGYITRQEMYDIVDAIYQMVVSILLPCKFLSLKVVKAD